MNKNRVKDSCMNKFLSVLLLVFSTFISVAQTQTETYQFSKDIATKIEKDTLPWRYQLGASDYSISEYYQKALETWDKNGGGVRQLSKEDSLYFSSFKPQDAKEYIVNRSETEKLIVINEAHHNARHRVFTQSLLQGLFDNGYRFFGLEALDDTLINQRKFPVLESGYYTKEPQMANLIVEAIRIGFTVFGYEAVAGLNGKERELAQAENIAKLMDKNPNAKFLIHCGYDHVIEGTPGNKSWEKAMAGRLKEKTGIDPFTIDQVAYSEKGEHKFLSPYILLANAEKPLIMVNEVGKTFNGSATNDQTDCRIIHPLTIFENNIPNWLTMNGKRKKYALPSSEISEYPILVLAYRKNEFEQNGIPAAILEILEPHEKAELFLDKGNYTIILKNKDYKIVKKINIKVK
jgi:hypothetical protein